MALSVTHAYNKDTATVLKAFTDEAYLKAKFEATGATNIQILECGPSGNQFIVKVQRDVPSNPPGFAKKFLASTNTVIEVDTWQISDDAVKKGTFEVDVKGAPVRLSGTMTLKPTAGGCENDIEVAAKCSIPLVGGKIASFIEGDTKTNLEADYAFTKPYVDKM